MMSKTFSYFSRIKKLKRMFFFSYSISLFFLLMILSIQNYIHNEHVKMDISRFGSWHGVIENISDKEMDFIVKNPLIENIGKIEIYNNVTITDSQVIVGFANDKMAEMANWSLKKGRFPEKEDEIAIEQSILDDLNLAYETNQIIQVKYGDNEKDLKIVGIIKPYTTEWVYGHNLPSIFVSGKFSQSPSDEYTFIQMKSKYEDGINEIKNKFSNLIIKNIKIENGFDLFSTDNLIYTVIVFLSMGFMMIFLLYIFDRWVKKHEQEIRILKTHGISNKDIIRDCFVLCILKTALIPYFLFAILLLIEKTNFTLFFYASILYFLIISLGWLMISGHIMNIPLIHHSYSMEKKPKKIKKSKKINSFSLANRYCSWHKKKYLSENMITGLLVGIILISAIQIGIYNNAAHQATSFEDFSIHKNEGEFNDLEKEKLLEISGIGSIDSFYESLGYGIQWEDNQKSSLRTIHTNNNLIPNFFYQLNFNDETLELSNIYGLCLDKSIYKHEIFDYITQGKINRAKFQNGEEIILYLPNLFEYDGYQGINYGINEVENGKEMQENSIQPGMNVTLSLKNGKTKIVKIGGIIRNPIHGIKKVYGMFSFPYMIIGSQKCFELTEPYNDFEIEINDYKKQESIESQVSQIFKNKDVTFENRSKNNADGLAFFNKEITIFSLILILAALVFVFAEIKIYQSRMVENDSFLNRLEMVGVDDKALKKITGNILWYQRIFTFIIFIIVISLICIFSFIIIPNQNELVQYAPHFFDIDQHFSDFLTEVIAKSEIISILLIGAFIFSLKMILYLLMKKK